MMRAAHTAEHLFAGSLRIIQPSIKIVKVDQSEDRNSLFIEAESLDWDTVLKAEKRANQAIYLREPGCPGAFPPFS